MLSIEDLDRLGELFDKNLTSARTTGIMGDAVYEKLEENSLGDMKRDIAGLKTDVAQLKTDVASMAEDVAKTPVIEREVRLINVNIAALRDYAAI